MLRSRIPTLWYASGRTQLMGNITIGRYRAAQFPVSRLLGCCPGFFEFHFRPSQSTELYVGLVLS